MLDLPLQIIRNSTNRGFAAACNQGAKDGRADYLLFLNPDTSLYADSLSKSLAFMERPGNQHVGICGVQLINEQGAVTRTCARFPTPRIFITQMLGLNMLAPRWFPNHRLSNWDHGGSKEVEQIMGAFFLVRRKVFEQLGGFDERFFVYFEEVDFSLRARQAGWSSYYLADTRAYHKGGGTSEQVKATRLFYSLRSRILYGYKHFTWWGATTLLIATLLLEPVSRLVLSMARRSGSQAIETIKGYAMLWKALPQILKTVHTFNEGK